MKRVFLAATAAALILGSCGESSNSDALNGILTDLEDIQEASKSFADGGATNGREYFDGILAEVVGVDVKLAEVMALDEMEESTEAEFIEVMDATISKIAEGRDALALYASEPWPERAEFHDLTLEWFSVIEDLTNDYLYDLAEPMSRPDEDWTQEEIALFEEYLIAYDEGYVEIDGRWVEFQYVYAAANNFEIEGFIDEEAMIQEELSAD